MAKYNYSLTRKNAKGLEETLQVVNCDSFEEAITKVEKGVRDRELQEGPTETSSVSVPIGQQQPVPGGAPTTYNVTNATSGDNVPGSSNDA